MTMYEEIILRFGIYINAFRDLPMRKPNTQKVRRISGT